METDLRLILLCVGLFLIVGIVFDGFRRKRKTPERDVFEFEDTVLKSVKEPSDEGESFDNKASLQEDPLLSDYVTLSESDTPKETTTTELPFDSALSKTTAKGQKTEATSFVSAGVKSQSAKPQPSSVKKTSSQFDQEIIVLTVMARNKRGFSGRALYSTLQTNQLKFNQRNIFDKHLSDKLDEPVLFSVASVTEPGSFDLEKLPLQNVPGLSFFLILSQVSNPLSAFEKMLNTARQISGALAGEVCDGKRCHLTPQNIEHFKERIREYTRKRLAQTKAQEQ